MAMIASIAGALTGVSVVLFLWGDHGIIWGLAPLAAFFWMLVWGGVKHARRKERVLRLGNLSDAEIAALNRLSKALVLGGYLYIAGSQEFSDWSSRLASKLDEAELVGLRPYLRAVYDRVRVTCLQQTRNEPAQG